MWTTQLQLYLQNLYGKVIVLLAFILYIYPSHTTADGIFSYKEENDYDEQYMVAVLKTYDDGTLYIPRSYIEAIR
ncbi:hypothetical protein RCL_jg16275.t1 [Rhizophagus clarus]|uniref:Uncharacterized protein n=1 Tax=Rhizophagus clarus TaxID=94130 RepID=A0A8H3M7Q1_9GLOM|nr:hypothetical protein RCL_jg16275.t1 [Rhizophagus clarus]